MSTDQIASNKATFTRFQASMSSGDWEVMSKTIDDLVVHSDRDSCLYAITD